MDLYVKVHSALEAKRKESLATGGEGPRVIIVGPSDSGKSTLSRILLSYACREGHKPIFVDLDIGQGSAGVPGCVTAVPVERPIDPEVQKRKKYI